MRRPLLDLTGQRFGRLVALDRIAAGRNATWRCRCDCGELRAVAQSALRYGHSTSCGCQRTKHGHTIGQKKTGTRLSYDAMMQRCHRPTASGFARYGGRGITVCSRWRNSYAAFLEDMGERPIGMTLDRIDNDGNYEPANCRWADHIQQQLNKATTIVVMLDGEALSLAHASRRLGRDPQVIRRRIQENGDPRIPHARERPLPIS